MVTYEPVHRAVTVHVQSVVDLVLSLMCDPESRSRIHFHAAPVNIQTQPCQEFTQTPFARNPGRWSRSLHWFKYKQCEYHLGNLVKTRYKSGERFRVSYGRIDGLAYRQGLWEEANAEPGPESGKSVAWPVLQVTLRIFTRVAQSAGELRESTDVIVVDVDEIMKMIQNRVRSVGADEPFYCQRSRAYGAEVEFVEQLYPPTVSDPPADVDFAWLTLYQDAFLNQNRKTDLGIYCGIANTGRLYRHLSCMHRKVAILPPGVKFEAIAHSVNTDLRRLAGGVPYFDPVSKSLRTVKAAVAFEPADFPQLCNNLNHGGSASMWNSPTSRVRRDQRLDADFDVDDAMTDRNEPFNDKCKQQIMDEWTQYLERKHGVTPSEIPNLLPKVQAACHNRLDVIRRRYSVLDATPGNTLFTAIDRVKIGTRDVEHTFLHGLLPGVHNMCHDLMVDTESMGGSSVGPKTGVAKHHPIVKEFRARVLATPWPRGTPIFQHPWSKADRSPFGKSTTMDGYRQLTLASLHAYEGLIPLDAHQLLLEMWFLFAAFMRPHSIESAQQLRLTVTGFITTFGTEFPNILDCPNGHNILSLAKRTLPALLNWYPSLSDCTAR
jgi:hypothetical protein